MRVQTEEWRRFIPGVRMYKGKKTFFWNGERLRGEENGEWLSSIHDREEQWSWEVIIVLPGVEVIPRWTFCACPYLKTVIMSDTVRRIERHAITMCVRLSYVRISRSLEYIGEGAFGSYQALTSIFIPPSCTEIGYQAFRDCTKLIIFNVPRQTQLGEDVIGKTALFDASPFETNSQGYYENTEEVHQWIKDVNHGEDYELHRACSSFNPLIEIIYGIVKRKGLNSWKMKNDLELTPFDYLDANPFAEIDIDQRVLIKRYVLEMMGETM